MSSSICKTVQMDEKRAIQSSGAQTVGLLTETIRVSIKPVLKVRLPNLIIGGKTLRRERDSLSLSRVLAGIEQAESVESAFQRPPNGYSVRIQSEDGQPTMKKNFDAIIIGSGQSGCGETLICVPLRRVGERTTMPGRSPVRIRHSLSPSTSQSATINDWQQRG
jgi:hypothetical protein